MRPVNAEGHRQTIKNAEPIKNCPAPTNVSELRSVLGLFNVGRLRIPHFAETAKPQLTESNSYSGKHRPSMNACIKCAEGIRSQIAKKNGNGAAEKVVAEEGERN